MTFSNNCDGGFFSKKGYLNIALTSKCPNSCIYCVAKKLRETEEENIDIEKIADTVLSFSKRFQCVVIEGGEPLLFPEKVKVLIDFIRPYIKEIYLFTSLPDIEYKLLLNIINKIDGCNISIGSFYTFLAAQVMQTNEKLIVRRNLTLAKLVKDCPDKFRVSFLLCKDLLDTKIQIENEINAIYKFGIKHIKIGEVSHQPELFVGIKNIWPELKLGDPCYSGCSTYIDKLPNLNLNNNKILIKRSCWMVEPSYKPTNKEYIKLTIRNLKDRIIPRTNYKVIYSDGSYANSW